LRSYIGITNAARGYHTLGEMLKVSTEILVRGPGVRVVEAGCGYGASTAKLSLAVRAAEGRLDAFDSFRGIPHNDEVHEQLDGRPAHFREGAFRGTLRSGEKRLAALGAPEVCQLHKGLFADTMPEYSGPVDVALVDVDLLASTRTCVTELFRRLRPGGVLFSLDGQLRATHELFADRGFWRDEVGVPPPIVEGLWRSKLLRLVPRDDDHEGV